MRTWTFPERRPEVSGPWDDEPDKAQWVDPETGLDCLIVRSPMGALCGYVGVPPGHTWHGVDYNQCPLECVDEEWGDPAVGCGHAPIAGVSVHGGLTYSAFCMEGAEDGPGVCHVPEPGRPAEVWWFGFDCAHGGDQHPSLLAHGIPQLQDGATYRDFDYVVSQITRLAEQLAKVS